MTGKLELEFVFESGNNQSASQGSVDVVSPSSNGVEQEEDIFTKQQKRSARRTSRRTLPNNFSDIEFNEPAKRARKKTTGPKVNYVKSVKKTKRKSTKKFEWSWTKLGWMCCGLMVLRLVFMESGIVDYQAMNQTLVEKERTLLMVRQDNVDLINEIHKIKTSPSYQKKLARDHLGYIAKDEYLILFSRDSAISSI